NDLGNLVSRSVTMCEKYFGTCPTPEKKAGEFDGDFILAINNLKASYENQMEQFAFQNALSEIMKVVSLANKYIDDTKPWVLGKDETEKARLSVVIYNLLECIRISARLLTPFMPESCEKIIASLGISEDDAAYTNAVYKENIQYNVKRGENLFPRIDVKKELALLAEENGSSENPPKKEVKKAEKAKEQKAEEKPSNGFISIDDFGKVKVMCCKVVDCFPVENTDKLLQFKLDDGSENGRQIVSSIHEYYEPADLIGKKIMVVSNLKPAKFKGVKSEGMLIACDVPKDNGVFCQVVFLDDSIPAGTVMG
ncbi:MAG: methionine--tRNA ligase subunit beta, partial [Oscillospiraceae bacterium]